MVSNSRSIPLWCTWGLFLAWLVHDAEEFATMPGWSAHRHRVLGRRELPIPPVSRLHAGVSIGAVGVLMAVAAESGRRSGGRSRLYQCALAGFGWHSATHIGNSVIVGGYTPGVATVAPVVLPFYVAARRALIRRGIAVPNRTLAPGVAALVGGVFGAMGLGLVAERSASRRPA